jgi:hypothetical protein
LLCAAGSDDDSEEDEEEEEEAEEDPYQLPVGHEVSSAFVHCIGLVWVYYVFILC